MQDKMQSMIKKKNQQHNKCRNNLPKGDAGKDAGLSNGSWKLVSPGKQ